PAELQTPSRIGEFYWLTRQALRFYLSDGRASDADPPAASGAGVQVAPGDHETSPDGYLRELDHVMSLALLAAVEGALRADYGSKRASLRKILARYSEAGDEPCREAIARYERVLGYRDYLAHGRWHAQSVDRHYGFDIVYEIAAEVFGSVLGRQA
ncbi:MAG TPA: hypothetical protein DCZ72_12770, partial [Armatimonadetes bacterium]|nr:hypothetical protein [Armatimonadota bacterium]